MYFFELVANRAVDELERSGLPQLNERERISNDAKKASRTAQRGDDEEVGDYYTHAADGGDEGGALALGQLYVYFYGARGVELGDATAVLCARGGMGETASHLSRRVT